MSDLDTFYGPNAGYVLELYDRYRQDPHAVDPQTRDFFQTWRPDGAEVATAAAAGTQEATGGVDVLKVVGAARLARLIREYGHLAAHVDPLGGEPSGDPELELATHGLAEGDLERLPASVVGGPLAVDAANALEAVRRLREAYSGPIGYEDDHIIPKVSSP